MKADRVAVARLLADRTLWVDTHPMDQAGAVVHLYREGWPVKEIANRFRAADTYVARIVAEREAWEVKVAAIWGVQRGPGMRSAG